MNWTITAEYHRMPESRFVPKAGRNKGELMVFPPHEFFYAIRRDDGSLLFRAGTLKKAEEIMASLVVTHALPEAA